MPDLIPEQDFVAEQLKDAIKKEETEATSVNVEGDYKRSKEFSTSSDQESEKFDSINKAGAFSNTSEQSKDLEEGSPENFLEMAQDVSSNVDQ